MPQMIDGELYYSEEEMDERIKKMIMKSADNLVKNIKERQEKEKDKKIVFKEIDLCIK